MTARAALSDKHRRFVEEYVIDFNGAAAAARAGYSKTRARQTANELLDRDDVKAAIAAKQDALTARTDVTVDEVVATLATALRANVLDYMGVTKQGDAYVDFSAMTREQAAALAEITVEDFVDGRGDDARDVKRVKFKLNDKLSAADKLLRHLGGYAPLEVRNPPGESFKTESVSSRELAKAMLVALSRANAEGDDVGAVDAAPQQPAGQGVRAAGEPQVSDAGSQSRRKRQGARKAAAR